MPASLVERSADPAAPARRAERRSTVVATASGALGALVLLFAAGTAPTALAATPTAPGTATSAAWPVAGRQGIIRFVMVPMAEAHDRAAYIRQIDLLCTPQTTCFINFFTNPDNLPLTMPLPDAIAKEPTALFRRSTKQGAEMFRWSCRMAVGEVGCF